MTAKRTSASSKKSTITRIVKKIAITLSVIAGCLFLLYAVLMGYENLSQYIVYKEAEQLLNDPMGRKDLLGMKLKYTHINPRTNVGILRIKPRSDYSVTNSFEVDSAKQEDELRRDLEAAAKSGGWSVTESDTITDSLYSIDAIKSQDDKSLSLTIYIDKDSSGKVSVFITIRCQ